MPRLGMLAALQVAVLAAAPGTNADPAVSPEAERRVQSTVRAWFDRLEERAPASSEPVLSVPGFEVSSAEGTARSPAGVRAWLDGLRSPHLRVAFRLEAMRIDLVEPGLYRARFEVDRRTYDAEGLPHVARWDHTWLVRSAQGEPPQILRIEERPALPHPGTGTRVVCN
jgi:hypothetical protein